MKRFNWRDLTEISGIIAIVASLIFVGLQLRQSQEIAIASQYQERASTAVEYYASQMQSEQAIAEKAEEILTAVDAGQTSSALRSFVAGRSPESIGMWFYRNRVFFVMLDNFHFQHRSGFMADESWSAFRRQLHEALSSKSTATYYLDYGANLRISFEQFCDEILEEIALEKN